MGTWWDEQPEQIAFSELRVTIQNALASAGIKTIEQLKASSPNELLLMKGMGRRYLEEVKAFLRDHDRKTS